MLLLLGGCSDGRDAELVGIAVLPADRFVSGPTSGQLIGPANGRTPPFTDRQPIQGFSALSSAGGGVYLALPDNGYGTKQNSPDFLLRVYALHPSFRTPTGGNGTIVVESIFLLRDPDRRIDSPLVADLDTYPETVLPVDPAIKEGRLLTGADFDVESFQRVADGTFYFGDEFGPFLIHTDSTGRVLEPPIPLPGVWSPQHPSLPRGGTNLPRSGGFEGMAMSADGSTLFVMLEKPLEGQEGHLNIYEYDVARRRYTHSDSYDPPYRYTLDSNAAAATEITEVGEGTFLVIERDEHEGPSARFKRVFAVSLDEVDTDGFLIKTQVLDLLQIADPNDLSGFGTGTFAFPFETTEALAVVDDRTVAILNDNNYPFSVGRHVDTREPDDSELILIRLR